MRQETRDILNESFTSEGIEVNELEILEENINVSDTEYSLRIVDGEGNSRLFKFKVSYFETECYYYLNEIEPLTKEELNEMFGL